MSPLTHDQITAALIVLFLFGEIVGFMLGYGAGKDRERRALGQRLAVEVRAHRQVLGDIEGVYEAAERAVHEQLRRR